MENSSTSVIESIYRVLRVENQDPFWRARKEVVEKQIITMIADSKVKNIILMKTNTETTQ